MNEQSCTPKVSICLICYNQKKYIFQAIESILRQKCSFKIEVLIADDASTDGTQKIVAEYQRKYPKLIKAIFRKKNVGPTANAYTLLSHTSGEYIASLEGDDYWSDTCFLEEQVAFLDNNPQYVAVTGRCLVVNEEDEAIAEKNNGATNGFWKFDGSSFTLKQFKQWKMPGHISATVYRNFYLDKQHDYTVFYHFHRFIGDRTTILQLVLRGKIYCTDKVVMHYRFVEKGAEGNWMSVWKNENRRYDEYKLICDLERYALEEYGIFVDMTYLKLNKVAAAAITLMLNLKMENFIPLMRIVFSPGEFKKNIKAAISAIRVKRYWIRTGKPDKRVVPSVLIK